MTDPLRAVSRPQVFVMEAQARAALPVIESLGRAGLRVVAGSDRRLNSGFFSRYCRQRRLYPSPTSRPEDFKLWLVRFLSEHHFEMLYPVGHAGTRAVSEIQAEVRRHTRVLLPAHETFQRAFDKAAAIKAAQAAGVPVPASWFPEERAGGLAAVLAEVQRWPVLVKPSVGVGARGLQWCQTADDVRRHYPLAVQEHGQCYLQELVPQGGTQYKADLLVDDHQRLVAGIVYAKMRMYPPRAGSSVLNASVKRPDILNYAHRMLVELKWVGFCDFDFAEDPRDSQPKLLELNPRFPESLNMGPSVGIDFPRLMYRMASGETVEPRLDYPEGKHLRFFAGDLLWFLRVSNKERFGTRPSWFRFFDRNTYYQLWRLRDPGPAIGYLLENLAGLSARGFLQDRLRFRQRRHD